MLSLRDRLDLLERDLRATPPRIHVYEDLPFALFRYEPADEWELRRQARLLAARLAEAGKEVRFLSLAELLWEAIEKSEGVAVLAQLERQQGFAAAQEQVTTYLSDPDWQPLARLLEERLTGLEPGKNVVFLLRAASLAPAAYSLSKLLAEMQGRTRVPMILFYPGTLEGATGLRFLGLKEREATGSYRVKIYG
ncbi:MAG: DUF1788 domain-containing protein [Planctomycetes bacterium]|nr:DUF1788 domain-containing protein [Planctomycetota bacterium]